MQPILQMNGQFRSTNDVARNFVQAAQAERQQFGSKRGQPGGGGSNPLSLTIHAIQSQTAESACSKL